MNNGNEMNGNMDSTETSEPNEQIQMPMKQLWNQQNENNRSVPQIKPPQEISTEIGQQVNPYQDYLNLNIKQNYTPAPQNPGNRINVRSNSDIMGRFKGGAGGLTRQ